MQNKRNTAQKNVIFCGLLEADHPTATELYGRIHEQYPKISRATVFRVLSDFSASGKVRKLEFPDSDTRYDGHTEPHAHCYCLKCGKVVDVYDGRFSDVLSVSRVGDFSVLATELEFCGLCPDCVDEMN